MPLFLAKHGLFSVIMLLHMLLFGGYAFGYALFFGVTYAPKRRLCSCICYFSVLMPYYALILGSNMLSRGDCATAVVSWCSVVCTAVLLAADCSLLVPPTIFSVLCVGVCASCFFVYFVLADCRC